MPQNSFFSSSTNSLSSGQQNKNKQKTTKKHDAKTYFFPTLHPISTVIFAAPTVLAFVLLRDSRFNFHCYTQREATPAQKSARKCAATSRDFLRDFLRERLQSAFTLANQLRWIAQSGLNLQLDNGGGSSHPCPSLDCLKRWQSDHTCRGAGIAQWLEHRTRDRKVAGSNPCWNGGRIFFSRVDFLCWLLFRYPFHPRVTTVARKKSRSFCQKCRWQVTAKHASTLRMWILLNRASALVTTCP